MSKTPSKDDFSAEWPKEVKEAYEHLKLPSLYDAVMVNEKLSLEIRRQDRDLKQVVEGMQTLSTQLNTIIQFVEEEWEEYEEDEDEDNLQVHQNGFHESNRDLTDLEKEIIREKQAQLILMETHDDIRHIARRARQTMQQMLAILPKKEGIIPHVPAWYSVVEGMLQNMVEEVEGSRYQLLARLDEIFINIIDPQSGEAFNESLHHVLDHIPGGKTGTIAYVVRIGYRQNQEVLRLADVTLYS